jgi:phosphoserine phosphatase RsbU/P
MIGLGTRLGLAIGAAALLPVAAGLLVLLPLARRDVLERAAVVLQHDARHAAESIDARLRQIEISAHILARDLGRDLGRGPLDETRIEAMLEHRIAVNRDVHGSQLLREGDPGAGERPFGRYLSRRGPLRVRHDFVAAGYDFPRRGWYQAALAQPAGHWTAPYFNNAAGGRDTLTYHVPLPADAPARGLLSLDLTLDRIEAIAAALALDSRGEGLRVALVDPDGRIVFHPDPRQTRSARLPAGAVALAGSQWVAAGERLDDASPVLRVRDADGQRFLALLQPIGGRGWRLALSVPEARLLQPLEGALGHTLALSLAGTVLLLALAVLGARRLSQPLRVLAAAAERLAAGDIASPLPPSTRGDEIGVLQRALERARASIAEKSAALDSAGERDRRLAGELDLARQIQRAMVPRDRVFLTDRRVATLAGALIPAKAVGGDFYNFFALGPGELFFTIGDVSDKGVPSALFAARLNALLGNHARHAASPAEALAAAAGELYRSNETGLFATVIVGQLGLDDGRLRLASAGHEPPLLRLPDGSRQWLELEPGPALGFEEQPVFVEWQGQLAIGAMLLLYTDGVTEAMTRDHQEFGRERIEVALERHEPTSVPQLVAAVCADVAAFADGAEPSDDLTLLALGLAEREH